MAKLADIVFDCRHPSALAEFWSSALDDYEIAPYDEAEMRRLAQLGIDDISDDPSVLVVAPTGPRLWFQHVPEAKITKNRVHVDVRAVNRHDEVLRLVSIGAQVIDDRPERRLTVLQDPEGNEFCVVEESHG